MSLDKMKCVAFVTFRNQIQADASAYCAVVIDAKIDSEFHTQEPLSVPSERGSTKKYKQNPQISERSAVNIV